MAYTPNNWVDREGTTRYFETVDEDGALIFTPDYTQVTELGTPVNADNMNHIEDGIAAGSFTKYDTFTVYQKDDLVTFIVDNEPKIYRSLTDNNVGNSLQNGTFWKEISLGSGGLEIGDIGIAPLGIDETQGKRRYLNGQIVIQEQYVQFTNKVKSAIVLYPTLACTEEEWQATALLTVGGQVGKFVVDDDAGTIRLPRIIMPIQGLTDLSKLAEVVEAGLPNIEGSLGEIATRNASGTGAFRVTGISWNYASNAVGNGMKSTFDASLSNSIYGNSNTVQQEQIQYPYFIQVATGAEVEANIVNEIELNNPYSLLDVKWSDKLLNNVSWLRSQGQANSKAVYNDVYELILREYNSGTDETETVGGVSITFRRGSKTNIKVTTNKSAYDSILSATGTAWYYVIDTANETFYLPQSDGFLQFGGNGDFVEAGLPNITGSIPGTLQSTQAINQVTGAFVNTHNGTFKTIEGANAATWHINSPGFNAFLSNPIYGKSNTVQPNAVKGYLYFYVGETVQNANLINAGRIEEKLVDLIPNNRLVWDGQWQDFANGVVLLQNVGAGSYSFDLSQYLPNDNNPYEIICRVVTYGDTYISFDSNGIKTEYVHGGGQSVIQQVIVPVSATKQLIVNVMTGTSANAVVAINNYRRLGTNI